MECNTIQRRTENPKEKVMVRDRPALSPRRNLLGERLRQERLSGKENQPTCASPTKKRVIVQKGMPMISVIHWRATLVKEGLANLGVSVRVSIRKRLVANRRNEIILQWSPEHWISPEQRIKSLRQNSLRRETFWAECQLFQ